MAAQTLSFDLHDMNATTRLAVLLAPALTAGDVVLLVGDVGAGKTHFARSLIQSILHTPEDVPSPTFTLVQTYDTTQGELWHADLYRLTHLQEIDELGLSEAFETAICLVEWPDRLGREQPAKALQITLTNGADADARQLVATWQDDRWAAKLAGWR